MARVTVEDCLKNVENRFELVLLASEIAYKLEREGKKSLVGNSSEKVTVLALREISAGRAHLYKSKPNDGGLSLKRATTNAEDLKEIEFATTTQAEEQLVKVKEEDVSEE